MKKIILVVVAFLGLALQFANAQSTYTEFSINACFVPYNQPNMQTRAGRNLLDYHGSGSADGLTITQYDVNLSKDGTYRYQLDVNGNCMADSEDTQLLQDYVDGKIDHLPGHWNLLNGIEKRFWLNQYLAQSKTRKDAQGKTPSWICGNYGDQEMIHTFGWENPSNAMRENYNFDYDEYWNIPMYGAGVKVTLGIEPKITTNNDGHFINATLCGPNTTERFVEDITKFSHWVLSEPQLGRVVVPGEFSVRSGDDDFDGDGEKEDAPVHIEWYGYNETYDRHSQEPIVSFDLSKDKVNGAIPEGSHLVLENPNKPVVDSESPVVTTEDKVFEYSNNLDTSIEAVGGFTITDNIDPNPSVTHEDVSTKEDSGEGRFNYTITRTITSTDASGNIGTGVQVIKVQDTKPATITAEQSISVETGEDTSPEALAPVTATDNGEVTSLTYKDASTQVMDGSINQVNYVITRTWTAIDGVGNESTLIQTITVTDTTLPTFDWVGNIKVELANLESEIAKAPTNLADNSGLKPTVEMTHYIINYDGGKVATVNLIVKDAAGNQVSKMRMITVGNPVVTDDSKPHLLKIYREGENLQIKYFADAKEKVTVEIINIGSGKMVKTTEAEVVAGSNLILVPFTLSSSELVVRVIDANTTNVQIEGFLDY